MSFSLQETGHMHSFMDHKSFGGGTCINKSLS